MMSRSFYHQPFMHVTGRRSHKAWRSQENRRYRAYCRDLMAKEKYDLIPPYKHKWCNPWSSPGDGKIHFFDYKNRECIDTWDREDSRIWTWVFRECWIDRDIHFCHKEYKRLMRK